MGTVRVALVGFGNVGQALADLLEERADLLSQRYHLDISVTGIATARRGTVIAPEGIDLAAVVAAVEADAQARLPGALAGEIAIPAFIATVPADILVELTPLAPESGQPAIRYCEAALRNGKHVVTANKGPAAYAYRRLRDLARSRHLQFRFESSVMDGAPIFSLVEQALPATRVRGFRGVINSTTNLVLTMMAQEVGRRESGVGSEGHKGTRLTSLPTADCRLPTPDSALLWEAVAEAQRRGIAEADPSYDLDGWDAAVKVCVLMNALMDADVRPTAIERTGIRDITPDDLDRAAREDMRIKLVAEAWEARDGSPHGRVAPQTLPLADPLATLTGTSNLLILRTDTMGDLAMGEYDGGTTQTAYGVLADILHVVDRRP